MKTNGRAKGIIWLGRNGNIAQVDAATARQWLEAGLLVAYDVDSLPVSVPVLLAMAAADGIRRQEADRTR